MRSLAITGLHFLLSLILVVAAPAEEVVLRDGQEMATLETRSGKVYQGVRIREITRDGVRIMHRQGFATVPAAELPQFADQFDLVPAADPPAVAKTEPQAPGAKLEPSGGEAESWSAASVDDVVGCCLFVSAEGVLDSGEIGKWEGSAFLCNIGETSYIYSNLHNFIGAKNVKVRDSQRTAYEDFVGVEVAGAGQGYKVEENWGGDVIRIRLKDFRPRGLDIGPIPAGGAAVGRKIVVTGNTRGEGVITRLEGVISKVDKNLIIDHTAAAESGNSGSPIVDLETFKVLGILTWGAYDSRDPMARVWERSPPEERKALAAGAGLATIRFVPSTFKKLYSERLWLNQLKRNIRLMGLMDLLVPTKQGLFVQPNMVVMGDYTVQDILAESPGHPVVKELVALDKWLQSKSSGKIGISNQDMLKRYIPAYRRCLGEMQKYRRQVEAGNSLSFYSTCSLKNTRALDIALAYEKAMIRAVGWFAAQTGSRGKAMPLAQRYRLPSFKSGLNGLGLQEE